MKTIGISGKFVTSASGPITLASNNIWVKQNLIQMPFCICSNQQMEASQSAFQYRYKRPINLRSQGSKENQIFNEASGDPGIIACIHFEQQHIIIKVSLSTKIYEFISDLTDQYLSQLGFKMEDDSNLDHNQNSIVAHHTQKQINNNSVIQESMKTLTQIEINQSQDGILLNQEKESSILKIDTGYFHNPQFKEFEKSDSYDSNNSGGKMPKFNNNNDETHDLKTDTMKQNNLKIKAFIGNQPSSLSGSQLSSLPSKDSNNANRKVKFTVQPSLTSEKLVDRIKKQHQSVNCMRKQDRESSKISIQLDNEMIYNGGSFRTEDRAGSYDPNLGSIRNLLIKRTSGTRQSQKQASGLINQLNKDMPSRQENRKTSNNTMKSAKKSSMNMLDDQISNNEQLQVEEMDTNIRFIVQEHIDLDIDMQYKAKLYFPFYNLEIVLRKVQQAQEERLEKLNEQKKNKEFSRSRTNMALQKLRSATFRATQKTYKENDF